MRVFLYGKKPVIQFQLFLFDWTDCEPAETEFMTFSLYKRARILPKVGIICVISIVSFEGR